MLKSEDPLNADLGPAPNGHQCLTRARLTCRPGASRGERGDGNLVDHRRRLAEADCREARRCTGQRHSEDQRKDTFFAYLSSDPSRAAARNG
jgi:hypothetical protein